MKQLSFFNSWQAVLRRGRHLAALGLLLATAGAAQAQTTSFAPAATYSTGTGNSPNSIAVADVNGDGRPDLLTGYISGTVGVLLGTGAGTFGTVTNYSTGTGILLVSIAVADVNGDGRPDLLTLNYSGSTAGVLLNTGAGTFGTATNYSTGSRFPVSIAVADVNGDGRPDLLTANLGTDPNTSTAGVLLNTGAGTFGTATTYSTGINSYPVKIAVADVNGDGRPDLLTANSDSRSVGVLLGTGTGLFGTVTNYSTGTGSRPVSVAVADVNGDGRPDLLTANSLGASVVVLLSTGAGTFGNVTAYSTGTAYQPNDIAAADVNGDGRPDLLTANKGGDTAGVLPGTGAGTFGTATNYSTGTGSQPSNIAVADVNGDGRPDLFTANAGTNTVGVLLNTTLIPPTLTSLSPTSGPVGTSVTLTGTDLMGTTAVSFNGTAATIFAVVNATTVTATVPTGATSGNVTVTTPSGTSNGVAFTVTSPATVATTVPANVTTTSATLGGNVTADGGAAVTDRGVVYSTTNTAPTTTDTKVQVGTGTGTFSQTIPGLTPSAMYYVRAYATNSAGTSYGTVQQFRTVSAPTVTTATPAAIATTSATLGGTIVSTNGDFVTSRGVVYSATNSTPSTGGTNVSIVTGSTGTGTFSQNVTGLLPGTLYYVQAYGTNSLGTRYGAVETFTTVFAAPSLTSLNPTSGPVGTSLTLTGTNLTGATGVSFNGTAATTFAVVNATTATATVPTGATTGNVTVTTGGGTSNGLTFTVTPAFPDLVVNTTMPIAAGTYNSITVNSGGFGVLSGDVTVNSFMTINSGGYVTSNPNSGCYSISGAGSFRLAAGGALGICDMFGLQAAGNSGTVRVTGTRSFSTDADYVYNGTAPQQTGNGLPAQVRSFTTVNNFSVTLTQPTSFTQVLTVGAAGNLVTGGNALTLLSTASGTGLVVNAGSGVVSGTVTVQRYIDPSLNAGAGYRHYSAPVSNSTMADLATAGFSPTLTTSYNASATPGSTTPFPTVFGYDQSRVTLANSYAPFDRGFVVPAAPSTPLAVGRGYAVNIAGNQLVDFVGTLTTGDQPALALSRVAGNADAGWQLLGNPYPAPLDYSRVAVGDRANLDASIYVYSSTGPYVGQYRAYVNGVGGNSVLPVAQGFFTRVSTGQTSGTLTFRNAQRLTAPNATAFQRTTTDTRPLVQLELRGIAGPADVLYAYAQTGATAAYDSQFDAEKLANPTGLNLSSTATSGQRLAIDGCPAFMATTVLPLAVGVPAAGSYTLAAAALANLPAGLDAYLTDAQTGQTVNLRTQPSYAFTVTAAQASALLVGRFTLSFAAGGALATAPALTAAQVELYPNPAHARFAVLMPGVAGASAVRAELVNALGQVVRRQSAALPASGTTLQVETGELAPGVYTLRLLAGPTTVAKRVVLQ